MRLTPFFTRLCSAALFLLAISQFATAQLDKVDVNGITIAFESLGNPENETILLIAGTGMQLIGWPDEFCQKLVGENFRVIRFDNRDVGLSTKMEDSAPLNYPAIFAAMGKGEAAPVPYTVDDMAMDAVGLLDALKIEKAHILGVSGGAIIAQIIAVKYPEHTLSLISMMGTTGNPALPPMKQELQNYLMSLPIPAPGDTMAIIDRKIKIWKALQSPDYPVADQIVRERVTREVQRCYYQPGEDRQGIAALVSGDRRKDLQTIEVPVAVIHGEADPIVPVDAGKDVAAQIPQATLVTFPGMGHDVPTPLIPEIIATIVNTAHKAH